MEKQITGVILLDELLDGGFEPNGITTIYGAPATGKTCLCVQCAIHTVKTGKKVIYVDSDNTFSFERLKQMTSDYEKMLQNILILRPNRFEEQKRFFEKLRIQVNTKIGLIIIDSIANLYRLELAESYDQHTIIKEFGKQVQILSEISKNKNVPILVVSHVYVNAKDKRTHVIGEYWLRKNSKFIIELQNLAFGNRKAVLIYPKQKSISFKITKEGIK